MENPAPKVDVTPPKRPRRGKSEASKSKKRNKDSVDEANNAINSEKKFIIEKEETATGKDGVVEDAMDKKMAVVFRNSDDVEPLNRKSEAPSSGTPDLMSNLGNDANEKNCSNGKSFEEEQSSKMQGVTESAGVRMSQDASTIVTDTTSKSSRRGKRKTKNSRNDTTEEKNDVDVEKILVTKKFETEAEKDTLHVSKPEIKDSCVGNQDVVNTSAKSSHPILDPNLGNVIVGVVEYAMDKKFSETLDLVSNLETDANDRNCLEEKSIDEVQTSKMPGVTEVVDSPSKSSRRGKRKSKSSRKDSAEEKNDVDVEKMIVLKKEEVTTEKDALRVSKQELKVNTSAKSRHLNLDPKLGSVIGVVEDAMDNKVTPVITDCDNDDAEPLQKKLKTPFSGEPDLVSKLETDANVKSCFEEKPIEEDQTSMMQGITEQDPSSKSSRRGKRKTKNHRKDSTEEKNDIDAEKKLIMKKEETAVEKDTFPVSKEELKDSTLGSLDEIKTSANSSPPNLDPKYGSAIVGVVKDATDKKVSAIQNDCNDDDAEPLKKKLKAPSSGTPKLTSNLETVANVRNCFEEKSIEGDQISKMQIVTEADATPSKSARPGKRKVKHSRKHIKDSTEEMNNVYAEKKIFIMKKEETITDKDIGYSPKQELLSIPISVSGNSSQETSTEEDMVQSSDEDEEVRSKSPSKNDTDVQVSADVPTLSQQITPSMEEQAKSAGNVLFVGNLPLSTQVADIKEFFESSGEIVDLRLPLNSCGACNGFGFVEFARHEETVKAFQDLNGEYLLGHPVRLEFEKRKRFDSNGEKGTESLQAGSKSQVPILIVCGFNKKRDPDQKLRIRNGLKDHFGSCGEITRCTFPMDRYGALKGIAYIQFKDCNAINHALDLNGSKFLGKTLIVDVVDTGVDDDSNHQEVPQSKKRKFGDRDGDHYHKARGHGRSTGGGGYSRGRGYYRRGGGYRN